MNYIYALLRIATQPSSFMIFVGIFLKDTVLITLAVARGDDDDEDEEVDLTVARAMEKAEDMDELDLADYSMRLDAEGESQPLVRTAARPPLCIGDCDDVLGLYSRTLCPDHNKFHVD